MSRYKDEGEFFEADLAARSELRKQMEKGNLYRLARRSKRMLAQHPHMLEKGGFQIESPDVNPATVGLGNNLTDRMSPEELVALWNEYGEKNRPQTIDWDTQKACYV